MSDRDMQSHLKQMNIDRKAKELANEVINRHEKLTKSPEREIIQQKMQQSFIQLQLEKKIDIEKLLSKTQSQSHTKTTKEH